jgi:hypothetical protein
MYGLNKLQKNSKLESILGIENHHPTRINRSLGHYGATIFSSVPLNRVFSQPVKPVPFNGPTYLEVR